MPIEVNKILWQRYYHEPPESKSVDLCLSHGDDHAAYGWCPQIDPRWSDEQKAAYVDGYEKAKLAVPCRYGAK